MFGANPRKLFTYFLTSVSVGGVIGAAITGLGVYLSKFGGVWLIFFPAATSVAVITFAGIIGLKVAPEAEHTRALQSHRILEIANETLPYLRQGLSFESASPVARIILDRSDAAAVAITSLSTVLGFIGAGSEHHKVGSPIITRATKKVLSGNEAEVLRNQLDIGCPDIDCPLKSAIVVPLDMRGKVAGTLKFYYDHPDKPTESRIALAEGLARLLSTQLELSEIDRQRELASQAELKALQAQINPHFLFNSLNTIAMFTRTNPKEARRLLLQFADFFRKSLEWREDLVPLDQELDYINSYLTLEKARFGDRLRIFEDVDDAAIERRVPALSIQPLVENAVKHGLSLEGHLTVEINARVAGEELLILIKDNGRGIARDELDKVLDFGYGRGGGIGLSNVNERLIGLYGEDYGLSIDSNPGEGTTVRFRIPGTKGSVNA
ncbi:MAG: histidine kinase [Chloroflexi bacterium]|nr:histidine kinase [Chloroflexota bacterium]